MTEVAREAGLSRAWLYRQFPDKASLVLATLARTDQQFWADAHSRGAADWGLAAQVAEPVALSREQPPGALLLELKSREPEAFAEVMGTGLREMMRAWPRSGSPTSRPPGAGARSARTSTWPGPPSGSWGWSCPW